MRRRALLAALPVLLTVAAPAAPAGAATSGVPAPVRAVPAAASPAAAPAPAPAPARPPAPRNGAVTVTGVYERLAKDLVQPDGSLDHVYEDVLRTPGRLHRLRLPAGRPRPKPGTRLRVTGTRPPAAAATSTTTATTEPARLVVSEVETLSAATPAATPAATTATGLPATTLLVILAYWTAPDSVTPSRVNTQVFGDDDAWFREVSYGLDGLTGKVTPWVRIPAPPGGCYDHAEHIATYAKAKAKALGSAYDSTSFQRTMIYFPRCTRADTQGVAGWAYESGSTAWLNGYMDRRTSVHEQGHNFGMVHADAYHCTSASGARVTLGGTCSVRNYADPFDAMGSSSYAAHNSGYNKQAAGWLYGRKRTMALSSETFTLPPLEKPSSSPLVVVVNSPVRTRSYWLEYRRPVGYDAALPAGATGGVLVRMVDRTVSPTPLLLDPTPGDGSFATAVVRSGTTWAAPDGVRISVGSATSTGIGVTVTGARPEPTVPGMPRSFTVVAGDEEARVSWVAPPDGGEPIDGYVLTVESEATARREIPLEQTSTVVRDLQNRMTYWFSVTARNAVGVSQAAHGSAIPDFLLPSGSVTTPTAGAVVSGVVPLAVSVAPNPRSRHPITLVEYYVDGRHASYSQEAPWGAFFHSGEFADGPHEVVAHVHDANGRSIRTAPVAFRTDNPAPAVTVTAPEAGATFDGDKLPVQVRVVPHSRSTATVQSVQLVDRASGGNAFVALWDDQHEVYDAVWDVTHLYGTRTLVAIVTDSSGRRTESAPLSFTVVHPPPTVAITSPAAGSTVSGSSVEVTADAAAFAAGTTVARVRFFANGYPVGTDTTAPYAVAWDIGASAGAQTLTAVVEESSGRQRETRLGVTVANVLPNVSLDSPGWSVEATAVTVQGTASPGTSGAPAVDRVDVTVDDVVVGTAKLGQSVAWSVPWNAAGQYGSRRLGVTAYTTTGARRSTVRYVQVRRNEPTATIDAPAGSLLGLGSTVPLAARAEPGRYDTSTVTEICFHRSDGPYYDYHYSVARIGCAAPGGDGVARVPWVVAGALGWQRIWLTVRMSDGQSFAPPAIVDVRVARPPSAPRQVSVDIGWDGGVVVRWYPTTGTPEVPIDGYLVTASPGGHSTRTNGTSSHAVVDGLANGVRHVFTVVAFSSVGTSPPVAVAATPGVRTKFEQVAATPAAPVAGATLTVTAILFADGRTVPSRRVGLRACRYASTCSTTYATTGTTGQVRFSYVVRENTDLTLTFAGGDPYLPTSHSFTRKATAKVTGTLSATRVPLGTTVSMKGAVLPVRYQGFVYLQRHTSTGWRNVTYRTQSTTGTVSVPVKMPRGTYTYRLYVGRTPNAEPGFSPNRTLTVY